MKACLASNASTDWFRAICIVSDRFIVCWPFNGSVDMNIRKNMAIDIGLIQVDKSVKFALKPIIHYAKIVKRLICREL